MSHHIKNLPLLKRVLWADCILGCGTALIALLLHLIMAAFLGLPENILVIIAVITLVYGLVALRLALHSLPAIALIRVLVYANWVWAAISVALLFIYVGDSTIFGAVFLVLQVVVVGSLAYLEGKHIVRE